jgi:hypothetical protein
VAGKTADFLVTVKKIEAAHLPEVNDALAKSLGIADGSRSKVCAPTSRRTSSVKSSSACWLATSRP